MSKLLKDQPPPVSVEGPSIWDLILSDMRQRDKVGRERYKMPLRAHNGRNALVDLSQELLDALAYIRQEIEEDWRGRAQKAEEEIGELRALFDLQWKRSIEAANVWRQANPGNELVHPDLGKLLGWLLAERERLAADLASAQHVAESLATRCAGQSEVIAARAEKATD